MLHSVFGAKSSLSLSTFPTREINNIVYFRPNSSRFPENSLIELIDPEVPVEFSKCLGFEARRS